MNKMILKIIAIFIGVIVLAGCSGMASSSLVTEIKSMEQFNSMVENNQRLAVLFYFSGCPGCKIVSPFFNDLAEQYEGQMVFCRVNVNKVRDVSKKFNARVVPRFMFFHHGKDVSGLVKINDTDQMPELFRKYAQ